MKKKSSAINSAGRHRRRKDDFRIKTPCYSVGKNRKVNAYDVGCSLLPAKIHLPQKQSLGGQGRAGQRAVIVRDNGA